MGQPRRSLVVAALLVLVAVVAQEPTTPPKLEASGESDLSTLGKGLTSLSFEGAERPLGEDATHEALGSDSASSDTSAEEARGPVLDIPAQSRESEEGMEYDVDSEEALGSQGI